MSPYQGSDNECHCDRQNRNLFQPQRLLQACDWVLAHGAASAGDTRRISRGMTASASPVDAFAEEPLPQRMRRFREESGLSRAELADRTGLSRPTIWAWEAGKSRPRQSNLETLAHALGISAQELIGKDQSEAIRREMDAMGLSAWHTVGIPAGEGNAHRLSVLVYAAQLVIAAIAGVDARDVRISIKR